jgi:hypothetical protein
MELCDSRAPGCLVSKHLASCLSWLVSFVWASSQEKKSPPRREEEKKHGRIPVQIGNLLGKSNKKGIDLFKRRFGPDWSSIQAPISPPSAPPSSHTRSSYFATSTTSPRGPSSNSPAGSTPRLRVLMGTAKLSTRSEVSSTRTSRRSPTSLRSKSLATVL